MKGAIKTMFIQKLKMVAATAVVLVALGAGGLAWRAGGVAIAQEKPQVAKPRTEVEVLRREVELLRLNLEVVLEKVRAQEAELREFRGKDAKVKTSDTVKRAQVRWYAVTRKAFGPAPDVVKQAEDAVRALRAARDPEARRRAADALEKALKALRGQEKPTPRFEDPNSRPKK
jgi:hypothetical protein